MMKGSSTQMTRQACGVLTVSLLWLAAAAAVDDGYTFEDPAAEHTKQARAFESAGDTEQAERAFQAAVSHEGGRPLAERHANLGGCLGRQKRWDDSIGAMRKAIDLRLEADEKTQEHVAGEANALATALKTQGFNPPPDIEAFWRPQQKLSGAEARAQVEALYKAHKPSKLGELPALFEKYEGKERKLLRKVKQRFSKKNRFTLDVPRVTAEELAANATLMSGHWAYILTGEVDKWPAMKRWSLDYLKEKIPQEWVDYYPYNMYKHGNKPYVQHYREAVQKFSAPSEGHSRYMQMRLSLAGWDKLRVDMAELPKAFWTEAEWIDACMSKASASGERVRDADAIDNFFRVNQWNFLLIGEKGTGIFFHNDHLAAASWQANIVGRKRWVLCPYDQERHVRGFANEPSLDPWTPDYATHPNFAKAKCAKVTVEAGEIIYYPAYWYHSTQILDTPMIGLTGLMVGIEQDRPDIRNKRVHQQFFEDLKAKCAKCWPAKGPYTGETSTRICDDISDRWPGAAPPPAFAWCNPDPAKAAPGKGGSYLQECYRMWEEHVDGLELPGKQEL